MEVNGHTIERCKVFSITFEMSSYPLLVLLGKLCIRVVTSAMLVGFRYIVVGLSGMFLM